MVDLAGPAERAAIGTLIDAFGLEERHGFFASPAHAHGPEARAFDQGVKAVLAPRLAELLPETEPFMAGVTSKGRYDGDPIRFHHDWTYTDERRSRPVFFWCPLVDAGPENGGLALVPGSHRWVTGIRPSRGVEPAEALQAAIAPLAVDLTVRAGQAVAFDPAVLHGSGPNPTPGPRPAFTVAVARRGEPLLHFHLDDDGRLSGAVVDESFFTTHPYRTPPDGYPPFAPWTTAVAETDLRRALRQATTTTA